MGSHLFPAVSCPGSFLLTQTRKGLHLDGLSHGRCVCRRQAAGAVRGGGQGVRSRGGRGLPAKSVKKVDTTSDQVGEVEIEIEAKEWTVSVMVCMFLLLFFASQRPGKGFVELWSGGVHVGGVSQHPVRP